MTENTELQLLQKQYQRLEQELIAAKKENAYLSTVNTKLIEARNTGTSPNTISNIKADDTPIYWNILLNNIYENSHSAILVFNTTNHQVISVNKRAIELFEAESISQFHSSYLPELEYVKTTETDFISLFNEVQEKGKASRLFHYQTFKGKPFWGLCQIQSYIINNESMFF